MKGAGRRNSLTLGLCLRRMRRTEGTASDASRDDGLIGDMQAAALVGHDGSVDWLCLPRFDSASCFSALGDERHGRWLLAPAGAVRETSRRYRPGDARARYRFRDRGWRSPRDRFHAPPPSRAAAFDAHRRGRAGPSPYADGACAAAGRWVDQAVGRACVGRGGRHRSTIRRRLPRGNARTAPVARLRHRRATSGATQVNASQRRPTGVTRVLARETTRFHSS
jgi:Domain of unknown function (DUF5911)